MNDPSPSDSIGSAVNKGVDFIKGFAKRILVHICSLTAAGIIAASTDLYAFGAGGVALLIYAGCICLFPRGDLNSPSWYLPTTTGLFQSISLAALGLPWPLTIFWGGVQTWLQRLFQAKGKLGWEWIITPVLAICSFGFFRDASQAGLSLTPLLTLPIIAILGIIVRKIYMRLRIEPIHRTMLATAGKRLSVLAGNASLPASMQKPLELLSIQTGTYVKAIPVLGQEGYTLAVQLDQLARDLTAVSKLPNASEQNLNTVVGRIRNLSATLQQTLQELPLDSFDPLKKLPNDIAQRINNFADSAGQLRLKQQKLPPNLGKHIENIATSTHNILNCMRNDQYDRISGDKFLSRYLPSTHMVVDEYIRLSAESVLHKDVVTALNRSEELLARLTEAFTQEHAHLLQNDAINYTAELNTLDTLLKMKGR